MNHYHMARRDENGTLWTAEDDTRSFATRDSAAHYYRQSGISFDAYTLCRAVWTDGVMKLFAAK